MKTKIANYEVDLKFDGSLITAKYISGDISNKDKLEKLATFIKSWCDVHNRPCHKVTIEY